MPRPLPPELRSSELLKVRLTLGERAAYELAAKAAKQTLSDYVRLVVGGHITLRGPVSAQKALLG